MEPPWRSPSPALAAGGYSKQTEFVNWATGAGYRFPGFEQKWAPFDQSPDWFALD